MPSHEVRTLVPWNKSYDEPRQHIQKQRHHFADKGLGSHNSGVSTCHVQMWELDQKEGWALKNWCFWTVVLEKTLRVPWIARRPNQSTLKEINSEYSLEGLMLKLKLQYFGHPMWRADSLEKTLMLGQIEGGRTRGGQRMRWLDDITDAMDLNLHKLQGIVKDRGAWRVQSMGSQRGGHLRDWTTTATTNRCKR